MVVEENVGMFVLFKLLWKLMVRGLSEIVVSLWKIEEEYVELEDDFEVFWEMEEMEEMDGGGIMGFFKMLVLVL